MIQRVLVVVVAVSGCGFQRPVVPDAGRCTADAQCAQGVCCEGACVDLQSSADHCGGCGIRCSATHADRAVCAQGVCAVSCTKGFADCNGRGSDGCEAELAADPAHCGRCGTRCEAAEATLTCAQGRCAVAVCAPGRGDCNLLPFDGCEAPTDTPQQCGACGLACALQHATPACGNGQCTIAACDQGYADCDLDPANGCEANLNTQAQCGACGNACAPGTTCLAGQCGPADLLFFGGLPHFQLNQPTDRVTTFDLQTGVWNVVPTADDAQGPGARYAHAAAWDSAEARLLVWGGYSPGEAATDASLYALGFAGTTPKWSKLTTNAGPRARGSFAHAWDPKRRQLFVFGGYVHGSGYAFDDLWQLDVASLTWTRRAGGPGVRSDAAMMWNEQLRQVLIAHGVDGTFVPRNDAWAFDPATGGWTQLPDVPGPGRRAPIFFLDRVIYGGLGGGHSTPHAYLNTLQVLDLGAQEWTTLPANNGPKHAYAYGTSVLSKSFVYGGWEPGGSGGIQMFGDLWIYELGGWSNTSAQGAPNAHPGLSWGTMTVRQ